MRFEIKKNNKRILGWKINHLNIIIYILKQRIWILIMIYVYFFGLMNKSKLKLNEKFNKYKKKNQSDGIKY